MIFNVGAGESKADKIKYGDSNVGATLDNLNNSVDELNESVDELNDRLTTINKLGVKNLIPYPYQETTKTEKGITFTDNGDGSVTVNGTATANVNFILNNNTDGIMMLEEGQYIASGCPKNGSEKFCIVVARTSDTGTLQTISREYGNGSTFTLSKKTDMFICIQILSGAKVENLTFYPMVRHASITDDTYEPYAMTNIELTKSLGGLRFGTDGEGNYGYFGADDSLIPFSRLKQKTLYTSGERFNSTFEIESGYSQIQVSSPTSGHQYAAKIVNVYSNDTLVRNIQVDGNKTISATFTKADNITKINLAYSTGSGEATTIQVTCIP